MSTLLINSGSDFEHWNPSQEFLQKLDCNNFVNIGRFGVSWQRILRSTLEWIAINGKPKMCILSIPYITRFELAISNDDTELDAGWLPIQNSNLVNLDNKLNSLVSEDKVKKLVDLYQGIMPDIRHEYETAFTNIILLASFFQTNNIKYLIFNGCNDLKKEHIKNLKGFEKYKMINNDKNIIDLFSFCASVFCFEKTKGKEKHTSNPYHYHPNDDDFKILENYFINYINSCIEK
jgi:hypothetical protein